MPLKMTGNVATAKKKTKNKQLRTVFYFMLIFLLWAGLLCGGYFYALKQIEGATEHFSTKVGELMLENQRIGEELAAEMLALQDGLQEVRDEMSVIQEELELAGESITGTDSTRQGLQERMGELDKQLTDLKLQLKRLEEATRAF